MLRSLVVLCVGLWAVGCAGPATYQGRVVTSRGRPVPNAKVDAWYRSVVPAWVTLSSSNVILIGTTETNADGTFVLRAERPADSLHVFKVIPGTRDSLDGDVVAPSFHGVIITVHRN